MQLILNNRLFKAVVCVGVTLVMLATLFTPSVFAGYQPNATNRNIMNPTDDPIYYYEGPWNEDGTINYYYYPLYGDPMYISDETMFGVWDETNGEWATLPRFRYSQFPAMADVEAEAKKGNYSKAKEELLKYYLSVRYERIERTSTSLSETSRDKSDAYMESMARNTYPDVIGTADQIGIVGTTNEWQTISVDVTRILNEAASEYPQLNVLVSSVDKYYTTAEVYSNQSDYKPVLKARVNGINVEFPCVMDSAIRAGIESKTNYGMDEVMIIEEHGCYENADKSYGSYDETTSRAMIVFDISSLKGTEKIENATIEIVARNTAPRGQKELNFLWYKEVIWTEDDICWDSFIEQHWFSCNDKEAWDFVTPSGADKKGKVCGWHRDNVNTVASRYAAYGDERFAYAYLRYLMGLINGIGCSPDVMNSLDMSNHVTNSSDGLYKCMSSKYMTGDILTSFIKHYILLTEHQTTVEFGKRDNNWATFATGAVYNFLARFPEIDMHDEWLEMVKAENKRVLSDATFEDGMCIELALDYVRTILGTYANPIKTTKVTGEELPYDDEIMEDIYNTVMTVVNCRGPYYDFSLSDSNHPYDASTYYSLIKTWYDYGLFDDPHLTYLGTKGAKGALPTNPTTRYWDAQRTYMRGGWGVNDLMLAFTNNVAVKGSHGHKDALSIASFAYGEYLLVDPGYGGILTGDTREYMLSPLNHNIVTVNDYKDWLNDGILSSANTLLEGDGKEIAYESNLQYDFTEYSTELFTTTELSQRSVTFVRDDNFWIITDYHVPNDTSAQNVYTQHWQFRPDSNFKVDDKYTVETNFDGVNIKLVPVEHSEIDEVKRVKTYYSEASGQLLNNEKAMIVKTKDGIGRFTTIAVPENVGEDITVETSTFDTGIDPELVNAAYFTVINNKTGIKNTYYFYHLNDESKKQEAKIGEYTTDATTLLIKKNSAGKTTSVFMMNGTYLKNDVLLNEYVIKSNEVITSMSYKIANGTISVASAFLEEDDMKNITLYSEGANSVYFTPTGSNLKIGKQGGYIYFGDTPLLDVEDSEDDSNVEPDDSGDRNQGVSGKPAGGGGAVTPKPPVKEEDKTEDVNPPVEPEPVTPSYNDVNETDWYFEYVEKLTEKNIVSGDGTGNFNPTANVTREQFLKMLIEASGIEAEETENAFTDVADAWYKPYVLKAKAFGIVNGISDTEFGIGTNITRQDMAVMITRTIEKLGIIIEVKEVDAFADKNKVSDYATKAVEYMKSIGLIEGYNNEYRPHDNLTRAEAAKVISELLKLL